MTRWVRRVLLLASLVPCASVAASLTDEEIARARAAVMEKSFSEFSPAEREAMSKAVVQQHDGDLEGAVATLVPLADAPMLHLSVLNFLASDYQLLRKHEEAVKSFRRILKRLGSHLSDYPWNVNFDLGLSLMALKRYNEAIPVLNAALSHPVRRELDARPYTLLMLAHKALGQKNDAYRAAVLSLGLMPLDSSVWEHLADLPGGRSAKLRAGSHILPNELQTLVLTRGDPLKWKESEITDGIRAYLRYAELLANAKKPMPASSFRRAATVLVFGKAFDALEKGDPEQCLEELSTIEREHAENPLPTGLVVEGYRMQIEAYTSLGKWIHAVNVAEKLLGLEKADLAVTPPSPGEVFGRLLKRAYLGVSFDPASRQLHTTARSCEFAGMRIPVSLNPQGTEDAGVNDKDMPYGMVSADEDWAEMFKLETIFEMEPEKEFDPDFSRGMRNEASAELSARLEEAFAKDCMALPVKLFLMQVVFGATGRGPLDKLRAVDGLTYLEKLRNSMSAATVGGVRESVVTGYAVAVRGIEITEAVAKARGGDREPWWMGR